MAKGDMAATGKRAHLGVTPTSDGLRIRSGRQDALRTLQERYQSLALATGQLTWTVRHPGVAIEEGDGRDWRLFTGQSRREGQQDAWQNAIHPDDRVRVAMAWETALVAGSAYEIEYRVRRFDGDYRWLLVRGLPTLEADGSVREWVGIATDITDRREAEETLRASEAQLADELADMRQLQQISGQLICEGQLDALYAQIVEAAMAVMRSDMGSMQVFHPECSALQLLASKGLEPEAVAFWEWVYADSTTSCGVALGTGERVIVLDAEASDFMAGTQDLEYYRLGGIMAAQSTPLISRDGRVVGMISTHWRRPHQPSERSLRMLDVLARQAADLIERSQSEEALRASERRKDEFLSIASHELRTPLTSIMANVEMARRSLRPSLAGDDSSPDADEGLYLPADTLQRVRQRLDSSDRQLKRLSRLVGDLLDVSRIQAGMLVMRMEACDLLAIVSEAVDARRSVWPDRPITLEVESDSRIPLLADADRIGQVVTNYLTNALNYSASDQPVVARVQVVGDRARVDVGDHGPGLAPAQQEYVFENYYRAPGVERQSGSSGGLGLGLHISKTIIERHGGAVGVESVPGAGSLFWFTLPLAAATPQGN
ncbi:MAG: ATP-binding protein [Ktedonobacterales bacterium]